MLHCTRGYYGIGGAFLFRPGSGGVLYHLRPYPTGQVAHRGFPSAAGAGLLIRFLSPGALFLLRPGSRPAPQREPRRRREFRFGWVDADQPDAVVSTLRPGGRVKLWVEFDDPPTGDTSFTRGMVDL